jgi:hypothetical protein
MRASCFDKLNMRIYLFYFKRVGLILSLSKDERQDTLGASARAT